MGIVFQLGHNDHKVVEDFLLRRPAASRASPCTPMRPVTSRRPPTRPWQWAPVCSSTRRRNG